MRVLAIFNKWWECDPALGALWNPNARPAKLGAPQLVEGFRPRPDPQYLPSEVAQPRPRALFGINQSVVEIWCLSDLLEHLPDENRFQSSTAAKAAVIGKIFRGQSAGLVIALGTAGYPHTDSVNGSVAIGSRIFIHDPNGNTPNPDSQWHAGSFDQTLNSGFSSQAFAALGDMNTCAVRFVRPPLNPDANARVLADRDSVAVSGVNVTDYSKYAQADADTMAAFSRNGEGFPATSVETTHGLIRAQCDAPFLFVSGITDRVGYFETEVKPRTYAQNTAAAHNAGVALGELIFRLASSGYC